MRGPHDLGGLPADDIDTDDADMTAWQKQANAMRLALVGADAPLVTLDQLRRAAEDLGDDYHRLAYFERTTEAMRRILIDRARKRNRIRHGGGVQRLNLDCVEVAAESDDHTLLAVDESLERFSAESRQKAELVKLRFFAGLTLAESAEAQGISLATAKRHWAYARAWLLKDIEASSKK